MKIFIMGGSSLLGKSLHETCPDQHTIESTWYTNLAYKSMYHLDVCNRSQIDYLFDRINPNVVIHCAGNASVDYAQNNYEVAFEVNVKGTENILRVANDYAAKVIYLSTNAVFEGTSPPYAEDDQCHPINAYGKIKRQAENVVQNSRHWLIIRPHLMYGWPWTNGRGNWAMYAAQQLAQGKNLRVVDDKMTQPLYAIECANAIWKLIEKDKEIFNVAGSDVVSLYEFVRMVAKVWGYDKDLVSAMSSDELSYMAPRPDNTSYDLGKICGLGIKPGGIEEGLTMMKASYLKYEKYENPMRLNRDDRKKIEEVSNGD